MSLPFQLRTLVLLALSLLAPALRAAEPQRVCVEGSGSFKAKLRNDVVVTVGAAHAGGFAQRSCQAHLSWKNHTVEVASGAADIDADALDVDLGLGQNVAAFQIHAQSTDRARSYSIYSLQSPVHLLRTLTGGEDYAAADTDLDGRVEIWTSDAAAFDGLDGLRLVAFDFAPPIVLRFEKQKLVDVSAEFLPDYDQRIASLRGSIDPEALTLFLASDGRMAKLRTDQYMVLRELLTTKVKALEIVACYLWSGRDAQADQALAELWPAVDRDRIRAQLVNAHEQGVRKQVDAVSAGLTKPVRRAPVYMPHPDRKSSMLPIGLIGQSRVGISTVESSDHPVAGEADVAPIPIQMSIPFPIGEAAPRTIEMEVTMSLLVDSAGKVREAHALSGGHADLEVATRDWKFIPAVKNRVPVAAWMVLSVSPQL
jgi:hypothetical protein